MANPEHIPELDGFDRLTVTLYRSGLSLASVGVGLVAVFAALGQRTTFGQVVVLAGVLLAIADMHLYDKRVRWVIAGSGHLGAALLFAGAALQVSLVQLAGLGFVFVALSGFALKERFCFRIPGLRAVPLGLAAGLVPLVGDWPLPVAVIYGLTALPLCVLCVAKWRMPLHFDIGDKSRYQI